MADNTPATVESEKAPQAQKDSKKWLFTLAAALAIPVFLETLDYTVVATAQSHIASGFNRLDLQSYIGTVYLLTSTVFLPVYGSIADVYGRYWAMQSALLFFLFGSALSTGARNMPMMLAGRGIAGIGAAGLLTIVRIILSDSFSLDANNRQAGALVILYTIGYCTGPSIGGALTTVSFRWVFAINLPCVVVSMVIAFLLIRNKVKGPQPPRHRLNSTSGPGSVKESALDRFLRVDWPATLTFVTGGILLLLALNWGGNNGWNSAKVIACLVVGALLLVVTLVWEFILERKQRQLFALDGAGNPEGAVWSGKPPSRFFLSDTLIPLEVMTNYDVAATQFAAFTSGMVMIVIFYFVAIFMVIVSGKTSVQAGVQLIYFAPGMGAGTFIAMRIIGKTRQPKYPIVLGCMIVPIGLGLISQAINTSNQAQIDGFMVLSGVGVGATFGPLAIHARFSQPEGRVAVVTSLNLFFRTLGGTVGLAQCSTVLNAKIRAFFSSLPESTLAQLQGAGGITSLSSGGLSSLQSISALPEDVQVLVRDAFRNGVRWCFISLIPWAALSAIAVLFLSKIHDTDKISGATPSSVETEPTTRGDGIDEAAKDVNDDKQLA
ncbi:hypothetical protein M0805_007878 [Coniferiporia weirii]|nr:hypothetical protein M0805_007878 [Coniferiporia weirii]